MQLDLDMGEEARADRVSLEVRSHDADEVYAVADLTGLGASTVMFRVEQDGNNVRIYGRAGGLMSWLFGGPTVAVRVWVPRDFSLDLRSASGPIRIEDVHGSVRARTTDASIEVRGTVGDLQLRTGTGDVRVDEAKGDALIRATQGSIELEWVDGNVEARNGIGDISLRHVNGEVKLRTDEGELRLREVRGPVHAVTERGAVYVLFSAEPAGKIDTRRGSIVVAFPDHAGAQLDAQAREGSVELAPGLVKRRSKKASDHYLGPINGGGLPLRVYTARGTIRVGQR